MTEPTANPAPSSKNPLTPELSGRTTETSEGEQKVIPSQANPASDERAGTPDPTGEEDSHDSPPEDVGDISPGALRVDDSLGEELYGTHSYDQVTSYGPAAFGNNNLVQQFMNMKEKAEPIDAPLPNAPTPPEKYVLAGSEEELEERLEKFGTACLTGAPKTGRLSTAYHVLANRHGSVRELLIPAGTETPNLKWPVVKPGNGYILRLPPVEDTQLLRQLAAIFRNQSASLVLIKDKPSRASEIHDTEVAHQPPDPTKVLRAHLQHLVGERIDEATTGTIDATAVQKQIDMYLGEPTLIQALASTTGPREVSAIAAAIARRHPADARALSEAVALSQPIRRAKAAEILLPENAQVKGPHRRLRQHERAFRLSYSVMAGRPMHYVFDAAAALLKQIDGEARRPDWGSMALQHPVAELLGPLGADWQAAQEAARAAGRARTARLRDVAMRGALIDVAWNEFDSTRPTLLKWLNELAVSKDESMRQAAAETAGFLAHHDFEQVYNDLVDKWANSAKPALRQAAARALVSADMGGEVRQLVRQQVQKLIDDASNYRHDTAIRAYASGLKQPSLAWAMQDLSRVAIDRMQRNGILIAEAISQLYQPQHAAQIILELTSWARREDLLQTAARAFSALARKPGKKGETGFELLDRLAGSEIDGLDVATLWCITLLDYERAPSHYELISDWLREAETDEAARAPLEQLLKDLCTFAELGKCLRYHFESREEVGHKKRMPSWAMELTKEQR